jgi:hypothetical protein
MTDHDNDAEWLSGDEYHGLWEALTGHYVTAIDCDHDAKTDIVRCSCSVWTGTPQPSVGAAVREWADHVMEVTSRPDGDLTLFHGHHPACPWTVEGDPATCRCGAALVQEAPPSGGLDATLNRLVLSGALDRVHAGCLATIRNAAYAEAGQPEAES